MHKTIRWALKGLGYLAAVSFGIWGVFFWAFMVYGMYVGVYSIVG